MSDGEVATSIQLLLTGRRLLTGLFWGAASVWLNSYLALRRYESRHHHIIHYCCRVAPQLIAGVLETSSVQIGVFDSAG